MNGRHVVLAITGASGSVYGLRLGEALLAAGVRLSLLISRPGFSVLKEECCLDWDGDPRHVDSCLSEYFKPADGQLVYYREDDFFSPLASGSSAPDTMVVAPCSMGSLARIAAGLSGNLLERSADVMLKEGRPLVLVPRETPRASLRVRRRLWRVRPRLLLPCAHGFVCQISSPFTRARSSSFTSATIPAATSSGWIAFFSSNVIPAFRTRSVATVDG